MRLKRYFALALSVVLFSGILSGCGKENESASSDSSKIVLRVANCEEYIDLGEWDEAVELDDVTIYGENALYEDFADWYEENYGVEVEVEYSTYGTNEDLYNQLTIGDVYDLVCPSEYMIMKMMREDMLTPYSEDFFDTSNEENYYINGLSPYIRDMFANLNINGESIDKYAAGYMWGTLGIVYNPEVISEEQASHWNVILDKDFYRSITIKDSVRDAYFAAIAMYYYDEITADSFVNRDDYQEKLSEVLNRTDVKTVEGVEAVLTQAKNNVYSFETDSGKADLVSGKIFASQQWSGDAVYTMDQAEEDGVELCYSAPTEGTNTWFDGWVMLKNGIEEDPRKQQVAEAFINYISMPENVIRNMYYIGYTSVITGGDSDLIFDYINYCYGAEDDEEETVEYNNIGYFFEADTAEANEKYTIVTTEDQLNRQLFTQYPPKSVVDRGVVMRCFEDEDNKRINRSWVNVRCFDLENIFNKDANKP